MTTIEENMKKLNTEIQTQMFTVMIENFLKNYKPVDKEDAYYFERDLHVLVRQVFQDAQAPILEHMNKFFSCLPPLIKI